MKKLGYFEVEKMNGVMTFVEVYDYNVHEILSDKELFATAFNMIKSGGIDIDMKNKLIAIEIFLRRWKVKLGKSKNPGKIANSLVLFATISSILITSTKHIRNALKNKNIDDKLGSKIAINIFDYVGFESIYKNPKTKAK